MPDLSSAATRPLDPSVPQPARPCRPTSRLRRSLSASTGEGVFAEVLNACAGGAVLTGWALHLGGGPLAVGALGALPSLAQVLHLPAAHVTSALGRRRVALFTVALSRQAFLPLVFLPLVPLGPHARLAVLLAVAAASSALAVIGNNAWVAWMGDLVPASVRGRYFGRRAAACTVGGTLASLVAGVALDRARASGHEGTALSLLALAACLAGGATTFLMARQHDPGEPRRERQHSRLEAAAAPFLDPALRALLGYQVVWSAAVGLTSSLFTVHMLQNLKMGYALIALEGALIAALRVLVAPHWGRAIDRAGAKPVLVACSAGICLIPLVWLLPAPDRLWPIVLDAVMTGLLWSGHSLASFALPLSVAPRAERPYYLSALSAAAGLSFALASAGGGAIAERLPQTLTVLGHTSFGLHALFVATCAGRAAATLLALGIVEPEAVPVRRFFRLALVRLRVGSRRAQGAAKSQA
ncbi:MAG: MFS transporter [Myxococcales bacterium]